MKPKQLTEIEHDILTIDQTTVERLIATELRQQQRSTAIRAGMTAAAQRGVHVGRPRGGAEPQQVLARYPRVVELLGQGAGIRATARATGVAINTVRKVVALLPQALRPESG